MAAPFSVAIVHYHLRGGGVTRVIQTAARCLEAAGIPHVILSGEPEMEASGLRVKVIKGLHYHTEPDGTSPAQLVHSMQTAIAEAAQPGPVIWHFHNHALGRNCILADAVALLAGAGERMVLQCHDFAEDGRPQNYRLLAGTDTLYPVAPQIRYAFLNSRDCRRLMAAGLPGENATVLGNPVTLPLQDETPAVNAPEHPLVLYPVRGIRRKNLGELFLLAALSPAGTRFAVTRGPESLRWLPVHQEWADFARKTGLPVLLDVVGSATPPAHGVEGTFRNWTAHATHFITTSMAEGFGLVFLEAAADGKPLLGRDLPEITADLAAHGILAGRLYIRLLVPVAWVGREELWQQLVQGLGSLLEACGQEMPEGHAGKAFAAMLHGEHCDFGNLPEHLQRKVISRLLAGQEADAILVQTTEGLSPARAWLLAALQLQEPAASPAQLARFSAEAYGRNLQALYGEVMAASAGCPVRYLQKQQVLAEFQTPGSFHFLCS